jgi:hypothetical protein
MYAGWSGLRFGEIPDSGAELGGCGPVAGVVFGVAVPGGSGVAGFGRCRVARVVFGVANFGDDPIRW